MRRVAAAGAVILLAFVAAAPHAAGDYQTVVGDLEQWVWLRTDGSIPMTAAVVRDDGWLVVATAERFDGTRRAGGGLVLVPPWGGAAIPFGDPPNFQTKAYGFTRLVARGDRLFGLTSIPDQNGPVGQRARLVELDARSGKVLAEHGTWWFPDLAVDPQTRDLVLWTFSCTGQCGPHDENLDDHNEEAVGAVTHQLVRYNPDTRRTTGVLLPDATEADVGGSGTCAPRRDTLYRCEEVFRVAFSDDGNTLFLGTARLGTNAIDVRDRSGVLRYSIPAPRPIDSMRFGAPSSCFSGMLVFTSYDGATWSIPGATDPAAASRDARQLASGAPAGASATALTPQGNMVTLHRSEALLLACPGTAQPAPPPPRPVAAPAPPTAPPAATGHAAPTPPAPPAATPPNLPPPVQPPSLPAVAGPASHATQAATGLNVGLADAQEEQPVYGLSASRRAPAQPSWAALGFGTAAALGFAAIAFLAIPDPRVNRRPHAALARRAQPALARNELHR